MNTNFFNTLSAFPDKSLLPNVWLTWETKTNGRIFMNCATGEQQHNYEPWMPSKNYYMTYAQTKNPQIVVTSDSKLRYAYSKYHEDADLLELAVVEMRTHRTGGARGWEFAEGGERYFINKAKQIFSTTGNLLVDDDYKNRFSAYEHHTSRRFKDCISYMIRCNVNENFTKEFAKLLGSNVYVGRNGRATDIKYAWSLMYWYEYTQTKKRGGKTQTLLDELCTLPERDLTDICKCYGSIDDDTTPYHRSIKDIIVYENLNDEWSVLRYCYRDDNDSSTESYRIFFSESGKCHCAKLNTDGDWVPAQIQNGSWSSSYGRIINLDDVNKSKRLSYILPIVSKMPESKQLSSLALIFKHPNLEKLYKMGYDKLANHLMTDGHVNANIKEYIGEPIKHAKTLYSEWGLNKYQLETLNRMIDSGYNNRNWHYRSITIIKKYFGNDISYLDNETFDRLVKFASAIYYHGLTKHITERIPEENRAHWINHMSRIVSNPNTPENCTQILADTMRSYQYATNRPTIDWNFDSYSDIVRAHDALDEIRRREEAARRSWYSMDAAERLRKEEEMRKKVDETRKHYEYEDDNYIIRLPLDGDEIIREGNAQHICIASYTTRHAKGETNLFFLRKKSEPNKPFYAIEMRNNYIEQIHGFANKWLGNNPEAIPTVMRWLRKNAFICDTKILTCTATGYSSRNATCVALPKIED